MSKILNSINYENCVGKIYKSNKTGDFKITSYKSARSVEIEFLKTGHKCYCCLGNLRRGNVKDPYFPSVYEVGVIGEKYLSYYKDDYGKKKITKHYLVWHGILERCYTKRYQEKYPTYKGCSVSENFKHYQYFYEWCNKQVWFNNENWCLDKDLLFKGNKVYSENNCVFLPEELNLILTKTDKLRGEYPIGVCYIESTGRFVSQISLSGYQKYLGQYNAPEEAFYAYKEAKEAFIKEQALKWKDQIDPRAFEALMNYEVDIDD